MKLHFLDVGTEKYGDCILIEQGKRFILVDGAHSGNYRPQNSTPSIPQQLETWMGPAPFAPDLLIITHVHSDHVGCLPQMVRDGLLRPKRVLAADERWGSGIAGDGDIDVLANADATTRLMAEAMQEEGAADIQDLAEARAFIDAFDSTEARYGEMLARFAPAIVVRFGRDSVAELEKQFRTFGLKFLGPTVDHLKTCAAFIGAEKQRAASRIHDVGNGDIGLDRGGRFWAALEARRKDQADATSLADQASTGSGKNNQSIVFAVGVGKKKVLLAGDMQFALAEVPGLRDPMLALLESAVAHGPYRLIKVTHHTANNGLAAVQLDALGGDPILIHTGGLEDPGHPARSILSVLATRLQPQRFARTDRNGVISVNLSPAKPTVTLGRGDWNNFEPNPTPAKKPTTPEQPIEESRSSSVPVVVQRTDGDAIEIIARIPRQTTRITITVDVQPGVTSDATFAAGLKKNSESPLDVAPGRDLPRLLVLTNETRLAEKIGDAPAAAAVRALEAKGLTVLKDVPPGPSPEPALSRARAELQRSTYDGVLILGGYDVVPSVRFSVIDDKVRAAVQSDLDDYLVWSDDSYTSSDGDGFPELPISRIPDAGDAELVFACLRAAGQPTTDVTAYGLRNRLRPFADRVFAQISKATCAQSWPTAPEAIEASQLRARHVYFMLHGHYIDGDRYVGEESPQVFCTAIDRTRLPEAMDGVVFAGCCYGALLTRYPAADTRPDRLPPPRAVEDSIALSLLRSGARAFVGCTGVHYSPPEDLPGTNGEPMHLAFWKHLLAGAAPADALFQAKRDYLAGIPHSGDDTDAYAQAVELKVLFQFTCLGLGW